METLSQSHPEEYLWGLVCSGKLKEIKSLCSENPNTFTENAFQRFNKHHSYVMGAYRTNNFEVVDFLIEETNAKVFDYEIKEITPYINSKKVDIMEKILFSLLGKDHFGMDASNQKEVKELFVKLNKYSSVIK